MFVPSLVRSLSYRSSVSMRHRASEEVNSGRFSNCCQMQDVQSFHVHRQYGLMGAMIALPDMRIVSAFSSR